jgi:hypothetical protein
MAFDTSCCFSSKDEKNCVTFISFPIQERCLAKYLTNLMSLVHKVKDDKYRYILEFLLQNYTCIQEKQYVLFS